jgi:riboflavin synthase
MSLQSRLMFTGLVEELGRIAAPAPKLRVECRRVLEDLREGDSVSVSGVCLTAIDLDSQGFSADLAPETIRRSSLGEVALGRRVNLERSVRADQRLGGHIVQGHVDGTGDLVSLEALGDGNWWLRIRVPADLERYIVYKGSIALDGISLTVAAVEECMVGVTIIPHTFQNTTIGDRKPGDRMNIETDIIAKYLEKLAHGYSHAFDPYR